MAAVTRFVVTDVDPLTLGALRFGGAFVVLLPFVVALRQPWPKGRDWFAVVRGRLFLRLPGALQCRVRHHDRGSMIGATLALMTMVVAALFGVERLSARKTAGVLVAASLLAAVLVSEPVGLHLVAGLIAVAAGIWIASTAGTKK